MCETDLIPVRSYSWDKLSMILSTYLLAARSVEFASLPPAVPAIGGPAQTYRVRYQRIPTGHAFQEVRLPRWVDKIRLARRSNSEQISVLAVGRDRSLLVRREDGVEFSQAVYSAYSVGREHSLGGPDTFVFKYLDSRDYCGCVDPDYSNISPVRARPPVCFLIEHGTYKTVGPGEPVGWSPGRDVILSVPVDAQRRPSGTEERAGFETWISEGNRLYDLGALTFVGRVSGGAPVFATLGEGAETPTVRSLYIWSGRQLIPWRQIPVGFEAIAVNTAGEALLRYRDGGERHEPMPSVGSVLPAQPIVGRSGEPVRFAVLSGAELKPVQFAASAVLSTSVLTGDVAFYPDGSFRVLYGNGFYACKPVQGSSGVGQIIASPELPEPNALALGAPIVYRASIRRDSARRPFTLPYLPRWVSKVRFKRVFRHETVAVISVGRDRSILINRETAEPHYRVYRNGREFPVGKAGTSVFKFWDASDYCGFTSPTDVLTFVDGAYTPSTYLVWHGRKRTLGDGRPVGWSPGRDVIVAVPVDKSGRVCHLNEKAGYATRIYEGSHVYDLGLLKFMGRDTEGCPVLMTTEEFANRLFVWKGDRLLPWCRLPSQWTLVSMDERGDALLRWMLPKARSDARENNLPPGGDVLPTIPPPYGYGEQADHFISSEFATIEGPILRPIQLPGRYNGWAPPEAIVRCYRDGAFRVKMNSMFLACKPAHRNRT